MTDSLAELRVVALDGQASGASPAYGDLIELGWGVTGAVESEGPPATHWVVPRTERRVSRAIRELTGWSERCLAEALPEHEVWSALRAQLATFAQAPAPCVIHYARFELPFLRDLAQRLEPERAFPLDVVCLHEIAARLFPDLPRRNIRALAGHLGHSPELLRRAEGHVLATQFIWRALLPRLSERSITRWSELKLWLAEVPRAPRATRRRYPLAPELRRALPERPGVYRFVRVNRDVLYVGKAASLKARVASHFAGHARATERSLEMLTQVADIDYTETPSALEAALLECDEIKRLDPPYNIHLRNVERSTWFASRDLHDVTQVADALHPIGPLPSRFSAAPFAALIELCADAAPEPRRMAQVLGVPSAFLPPVALFSEGFAQFRALHLLPAESPTRQVDRAARALWLLRGRSEPDTSSDDAAPDAWDLARVLRRLERNLIQAGLTLRRARWLCLLAEADVAYREPQHDAGRLLSVRGGEIVAHETLAAGLSLSAHPVHRPAARASRQTQLNIAAYDRLRVLATELRRVLDDGGDVLVRIGRHEFARERFARLTREV